jgi:hypothetical protein
MRAMSHTDTDRATAAAIVAHHSTLAADLNRRVTLLRAAASPGTDPQWAQLRQDLVSWLRTELMPHAVAEEAALYPPAAGQSAGRLLVDGMVAEHRAIAGLIRELESAATAVDAVGAARALSALFEVHLDKENGLVLPLLLASDISLTAILTGMHDLLGEPEHSHLGHNPGETQPESACGGHGCGCGGGANRADGTASVPVQA